MWERVYKITGTYVCIVGTCKNENPRIAERDRASEGFGSFWQRSLSLSSGQGTAMVLLEYDHPDQLHYDDEEAFDSSPDDYVELEEDWEILHTKQTGLNTAIDEVLDNVDDC